MSIKVAIIVKNQVVHFRAFFAFLAHVILVDLNVIFDVLNAYFDVLFDFFVDFVDYFVILVDLNAYFTIYFDFIQLLIDAFKLTFLSIMAYKITCQIHLEMTGILVQLKSIELFGSKRYCRKDETISLYHIKINIKTRYMKGMIILWVLK